MFDKKRYNKSYYKKNRDHMIEVAKKWHKNNRERAAEYQRNSNHKMRSSIINHYGKRCVCCGETNIEFLSIDHIQGNGKVHRKKYGVGRKFYLYIIRNNFPPSLRVLCYNCNLSRGFVGYCPHESININME